LILESGNGNTACVNSAKQPNRHGVFYSPGVNTCTSFRTTPPADKENEREKGREGRVTDEENKEGYAVLYSYLICE